MAQRLPTATKNIKCSTPCLRSPTYPQCGAALCIFLRITILVFLPKLQCFFSMFCEKVTLGGIMYALSTPQRSVTWRDSLRDESGRSSSKFKYDVDSSPGASLRASQLETAARLSSPFLQRLAAVAVDASASQPEQPGAHIPAMCYFTLLVWNWCDRKSAASEKHDTRRRFSFTPASC